MNKSHHLLMDDLVTRLRRGQLSRREFLARSSALLAAGGIIGRNDVGAVSGCRNFGAVACALHAGALVGWNKHSVEDSAAGGSVNGTALTGTNYAELAVGFQDGGSSSGITFGEK